MNDVGNRIKELRTEKKMTIDMIVADMNKRYPALKLNKSMLSRWENNINEPSLGNSKYLALYFDVSLDYLAGLTDIRKPIMMDKYILRENIKNNLHCLRIKNGITQATPAEIIGKTPTAVASWEQGLSLPDVTTLYRLSKYYNCMMEYFYEDHEEDA